MFRRNKWASIVLIVGMVLALTALPMVAGGARMAQELMLVTTGSSGRGGNHDSMRPVLSADGSTLVFFSEATDLVDGIVTNGNEQVYAYDIASGVTTLISKGPGTGGDRDSSHPDVSGDGTRIVFQSYASDLIEGEPTTGTRHIYLYDCTTGMTTLVDKRYAGSTENAYEPVISTDGTKIVFDSKAPDLIEGTTLTVRDYALFRYDVVTGETILITKNAAGEAIDGEYPAINGDGTRVSFRSRADDLIPGSGLTGNNMYLWDETDGYTPLTLGEGGANHDGSFLNSCSTISDDGTRVAFSISATNLAGAPANGVYNAFLWDETDGLSLISTGSSSIGGNDGTYGVNLSPDGMQLGVASVATDLVADKTTTDAMNVFLYDLTSGTAELITEGPEGIGGDRDSYRPSVISVGPNGLIAFHSAATDLVDGLDVFLPDGWNSPPYNVYLWGRVELLTVTFDAQNGTTPLSREVAWGSKAPAVSNPTKAGYTFTGWWTAPSGGSLWDFNTPVTADMTLYAQWVKDVPGLPPTGDGALLMPLVTLALLGSALVAGGAWRKRDN